MALGNGARVSMAVYRARAKVGTVWIPIFVQESEGDILAGMSLFDGMTITIEDTIGGQVSVEPSA